MKFKLRLGSFYYSSKLNAAFGLEGYPDTIPDIPVKLKINMVKGDIFWGELIQEPTIKDNSLVTYLSGVQDNDGVLNIVTTNNTINNKGVIGPLGPPPGHSLMTTIKLLKDDTYEIISRQFPGYISKSIGIFKPKEVKKNDFWKEIIF